MRKKSKNKKKCKVCAYVHVETELEAKLKKTREKVCGGEQERTTKQMKMFVFFLCGKKKIKGKSVCLLRI